MASSKRQQFVGELFVQMIGKHACVTVRTAERMFMYEHAPKAFVELFKGYRFQNRRMKVTFTANIDGSNPRGIARG